MKTIKYLFLAMVAIVSSAAFVACGSDDDEETKVETKKSSFYYAFSFSDDILSVADVTISYIGTDGVEKSETVTSTSWSKTFTENKYDVSAGVSLSMKLKNGVELTSDKYRIQYMFTYAVKSTKGDTTVGFEGNTFSQGSSVRPENVETMLQRKSGTTAFKIDSDGKVSATTLSWQSNSVEDGQELTNGDE